VLGPGLAGVAPSTRKSGQATVVTFRWAADKQLRDAVCDFAGDSRHANPWAADLYHRAIARGHDHPHATRIMARAWLYIIWHCWQTGTAYDPAKHRALQAITTHTAPRPPTTTPPDSSTTRRPRRRTRGVQVETPSVNPRRRTSSRERLGCGCSELRPPATVVCAGSACGWRHG
jgi:hypothetical protein